MIQNVSFPKLELLVLETTQMLLFRLEKNQTHVIKIRRLRLQLSLLKTLCL